MVKDLLKNYKRLRTLVDQWIELSTELCQQKLELQAKELDG